jgi:hypothetical protein
VAWDDNVKTEYIWGNFECGSTRRLQARLGGPGGLGGIGGLVRKSLTLEWD